MATAADLSPRRRSLASRLLDPIEWIGNKLPDPLTLFVILAAAVPFISWMVAQAGWSVAHPKSGDPVTAVNLLGPDYLRRMFTDAVSNFTSFRPLGVVLVAMIGIGVVERTGLIATVLKMVVMAVPRALISAAVVFAGMMSSLAADVGYVVLTPLGAVIFAGLGRHPLAGLAAAFAGVAAGFSANLVVTPLDSLLAGLTQEAAAILDPDYKVYATANWWLMIAATGLLTGIGWWVTDKIVEPRLGRWVSPQGERVADEPGALSERERRGAWCALATFLLVLAGVALISIPPGSLLHGTAAEPFKPLQDSIVVIMMIAFFLPGLVFGLVTGTIRDDKTVARMTAETMNTMGVYIVLAFVAAQFIEYFRWSNLGTMLAISGANALKSMNLGGGPLIVAFVLVAAFINLFIGSASAKWALIGPVFVPMLMQMGISPEATQAAYRIGDSVTNPITPLLPYFPVVIAFGRKYDKDLGIGTLTAAMLPYSLAFLLGWLALLLTWWMLDLPLGPGATMSYAP